jgi:hypothetical protein
MTTFKHIMSIVCQGENILPDILLQTSGRRNRELVFARQCIFYLMRKNTEDSLKKIGSYLKKDHASVIHSCKTIRNLMETDKAIAMKVKTYEKNVELAIKFDYSDGMKKMEALIQYISNCIRDGIEIPQEVIDEYNLLIKGV